MNPLENAWSSLVQRRLLPVAILLVAALAAIPFVLAKDSEPVAPPATPSADKSLTADASPPDPVVALAEDGSTPKQRRRVLGASKNPFEPAAAPKATATATPSATTAAGSAGATPSTGSSSGGSVAGATAPSSGTDTTSSTPVTPVGSATPAPRAEKPASEERTYSVYSAVVRFGNPEDGEPEQRTLPRLTPLPDEQSPAAVYLGVGPDADDETAAYFLIGDAVELEDDDDCRPSKRDCQGIVLRVGKSATLRFVDEQTGEVTGRYVIEVVKIKRKVVTDPAEAQAARARSSTAGRRALRAHKATYGPLRYRYDATSGTVRKIGKRAYKALLAKTARAALGTAGGF